MNAGQLGWTVVYVIILVSSAAVLSEVYGDLLRGGDRSVDVALADRLANQASGIASVQGGSLVSLGDMTFKGAHANLKTLALIVGND